MRPAFALVFTLALPLAGAGLPLACTSAEPTPSRSGRAPKGTADDPFARAPIPLSEITGGPSTAPLRASETQPDAAIPDAGVPDTPAPDAAVPNPAAPITKTSDVIARIELELPANEPFVLRACLPVPPGFELGPPERTPLAVASRSGGAPSPAQLEVVTRGPRGQIEVVELLASVTRARDDDPHERVRFEVIRGDWSLPDHTPRAPEVETLLAAHADTPFALRTRDVFGNTYRFPLRTLDSPALGGSKILKRGPAHELVRLHGALIPVESSGKGAPLPRMLGVHAYIGTFHGSRALALDLRLHHGVTAGSGSREERTEPLGPIHWEALELELPEGWCAAPLVKDPFFGPARAEGDRIVVPLVRPNRVAGTEAAPLHAAIPGVQFQRRLVVYPGACADPPPRTPQLAGLGFCVEGEGLWSWFREETARYMAQREVLTHYQTYRRGDGRGVAGLRRDLAQRRRELQALLETGRADGHEVHGRVMGWAHPWYVKAQGGTGGAAIQITEGHEAAASASVDGVEWLMLLHRMNVSRQPTAMFTWDGEPAGFHAWLTDEDKIPFDYRTNGRMLAPELKLPSEGGPSANPHWRSVARAGRRPRYDRGPLATPRAKIVDEAENLWAWMPHDGAHLSRYTKNPKALAWLANDALAKDDLLLAAELFRLQFHEARHDRVPWSEGVTLREFVRTAARARPGTGAHLGREHGWGMDAMSCAYSLGDDTWRARQQSWFGEVGRMLLAVAMPNGLVIRNGNPKILGHDKYDAAQAFQSLFILHGTRTMVESALRGVEPGLVRRLEALHHRALRALFWPPIYQRVPWKEQHQPRTGPRRYHAGPRVAFAVAEPLGTGTPPFSDPEHWGPQHIPEDGFNGGIEFFYVWSALEYGYLLDARAAPAGETGLENRYLQRALACWTLPKTHCIPRTAALRADGSTGVGQLGQLGRIPRSPADLGRRKLDLRRGPFTAAAQGAS